MHFKPGVWVAGLQAETVLGMVVAEQLFSEYNQRFTITSVLDGTHKANSLHYKGLAFDIRIFDLRGISADRLALHLRDRLPVGYQVIVESDHIHVEFDHG